MSSSKRIIVGLHITNRVQNAKEVQAILTEYGCNIKTRLGLHEVDEKHCATSGLLLLELTGKEEQTTQLVNKLKNVAGIDFQKMEFAH